VPQFEKKEVNTMISRIDRKRIFIFVAIVYGITIALAVVLFFSGGLCTNCPFGTKGSATILLSLTMFAPAAANIATRLITREGWSNTFLRPNLRRGWPFLPGSLVAPARGDDCRRGDLLLAVPQQV
jgi:hypothetical protein